MLRITCLLKRHNAFCFVWSPEMVEIGRHETVILSGKLELFRDHVTRTDSRHSLHLYTNAKIVNQNQKNIRNKFHFRFASIEFEMM